MIKVFFDASVLFSAIYSDKGASRKLVTLVKSHTIIGITSQTVIEELERNIEKFKRETNTEIHTFIAVHDILVRKVIESDELEPYQGLVEEKDAHVVAGAIQTSSDYLVTLDKKHLNNNEVKKKIKLTLILSPAELLLQI